MLLVVHAIHYKSYTHTTHTHIHTHAHTYACTIHTHTPTHAHTRTQDKGSNDSCNVSTVLRGRQWILMLMTCVNYFVVPVTPGPLQW